MGSSSRWLKNFQYRLYSALGRTWYFFLEHLGSQQGGCQQKESYGYTSAECRDFWSHIELQIHLLFLQLTWLPSFPGWAKCVEWVGAVWGQVALWLNWAPSPPIHTQSGVSKWEPMFSLSFMHGCTCTTLVFNKSRCQMSLEATCQRLCSEVAFRGDAVDLQEEGPISLMT